MFALLIQKAEEESEVFDLPIKVLMQLCSC